MKHGLFLAIGLAGCTPATPPAPPAREAVIEAAALPDAVAPPASEASVPSPPPGPSPALARLTGRVTYPSEELPAMRVCALDSADPGRALCVSTATGQAGFSFEVPPGEWWLLAWPHGTGTAGDPGLVSAASACLARAETGCDDHALLALRLAPGEVRGGIEINDWYYDPTAFPPPMAPRDDTAD